MYLPKSLYEALPYLYIASGVAIFMAIGGPWVYLSASLLYAAGALVWVTRSAYRRKNSRHRIRNRKGRVRFPEQLYEYLPFIYLGLGLVVLQLGGSYGIVPGIALCLAGGLVWMIRAIYRSQSGAAPGH